MPSRLARQCLICICLCWFSSVNTIHYFCLEITMGGTFWILKEIGWVLAGFEEDVANHTFYLVWFLHCCRWEKFIEWNFPIPLIFPSFLGIFLIGCIRMVPFSVCVSISLTRSFSTKLHLQLGWTPASIPILFGRDSKKVWSHCWTIFLECSFRLMGLCASQTPGLRVVARGTHIGTAHISYVLECGLCPKNGNHNLSCLISCYQSPHQN